MSSFKNRSAIQVGRDRTAFLNLELGTVRGSYVPNYERLFERAQSQRIDRDQRLHQAQEQLDEKERRLSRTRLELDNKDEQVIEKKRQLSGAREQLAEDGREISRLRRRLAEQDRRLAEARARAELGLGDGGDEEGEDYDRRLHLNLSRMLDGIPADTGGGCSLSKAYMIAALISRHGMQSTLDIGVYRGRSFFPQAHAHREYTGGIVYGVDPWSLSEAREEELSFTDAEREQEVSRFVEETDWEHLYQEVERSRSEMGYEDHSEVLRCTSAEASVHFENNGVSFDLIHVDGNHDTDKVARDVELYLPLLRENGYIILDDVSFESVKPAYDELSSRMRLVFQRVDQDGKNDYAVFRNTQPFPETSYNQRFWTRDFW